MNSRFPFPSPFSAMLVAVMLMSSAGVHAGSPGDWLVRMTDAMRSLSYKGVFVYEHGRTMQTMSLVHGVIDGVEHERLASLTGEPIEIIRNGDRVVCIWPASERVLVSERRQELLPAQLPRDLDEVPPSYEVSLGGDSRMAGREAQVLMLRPVDGYRYGYHLWLDTETALLLRSDILDSNGEVVERLMFTELHLLDEVTPELFQPAIKDLSGLEHAVFDTIARDRVRPMQDPGWIIDDLPPGFDAIAHSRDVTTPHRHVVQHSVYSDGLAAVSLFVEAGEREDDIFQGHKRMGAVNAYRTHAGTYAITVVGEVPAATVRRMAVSVERSH